MTEEIKPIDISHMPELLRIAEEVWNTQEPRVLRRDSEDLAILMPVSTAAKTLPIGRRLRRGKPIRADDSLWNIVGIAASEGPTDVSENTQKYLAEAYAAEAQ